MRIPKNTEILLTEAPSTRFLLVVDVMDGDVALTREGYEPFRLSLVGDDVHARVRYPDGREITLVGAGARGKEVILTAGYARTGLYVNGVLLDEDFFYTPIEYKDALLQVGSFSHFEAGYEYHSAEESAIVESVTEHLDGYALTGTGRTLCRVLPTVIGDRLHLLYLDAREGRTKDAHKLCAMFSDDGVTFHGAPIALGIDNVREEDILDAALLRVGTRYYLYYIVRYAMHTALTVAVSEDGFSYIKTGLDVEIAGIENQGITSVSVTDAPTPTLYFVKNGEAYSAESIDLLHFSSPTRLAVSSVDKLLPVKDALFAQQGGRLYRLTEGALSPVAGAPRFAIPVSYGDALLFIGEADGAFAFVKQ